MLRPHGPGLSRVLSCAVCCYSRSSDSPLGESRRLNGNSVRVSQLSRLENLYRIGGYSAPMRHAIHRCSGRHPPRHINCAACQPITKANDIDRDWCLDIHRLINNENDPDTVREHRNNAEKDGSARESDRRNPLLDTPAAPVDTVRKYPAEHRRYLSL